MAYIFVLQPVSVQEGSYSRQFLCLRWPYSNEMISVLLLHLFLFLHVPFNVIYTRSTAGKFATRVVFITMPVSCVEAVPYICILGYRYILFRSIILRVLYSFSAGKLAARAVSTMVPIVQ